MWIVGVTGALGSGKSTMTLVLRKDGVPVLSVDQEVHTLLAEDKSIQREIKALWPEAYAHGKIDRKILGDKVLSKPEELKTLEDIIYPKLGIKIKKFIIKNNIMKSPIVVLDVPLLIEIGLDNYCNCVIVVSASSVERKKRVLKRYGMTVKKFESYSMEQISERERKKRADFVIYTGRDKVSALKRMGYIVNLLKHFSSPRWDGKWPKNFKKDLYGKGNRLRYRNNRF